MYDLVIFGGKTTLKWFIIQVVQVAKVVLIYSTHFNQEYSNTLEFDCHKPLWSTKQTLILCLGLTEPRGSSSSMLISFENIQQSNA